MFYSEKKAEDFLEKKGFDVVKRMSISSNKDLENALKRFIFPIVMKVSGEGIVHKDRVGGVKINIKNREEASEAFKQFEKIKGFEGATIQEQLQGRKVLIGVKKTEDFGHAVCVGSGGTKTEDINDVSFRIPPFDNKEAKKMISETKISKFLKEKEKKAVEDNLLKVCNLVQRHPDISELDINPLMVNGNRAIVVDARIVMG